MSGRLPAGLLNRTITLQTATKTQDAGTGEEVIDWTAATAVQLPAQWLAGNTREGYQAGQRLAAAGQRLAAYVDGVFRIRYRDRPSPENQRIVFDGRPYDLKPPIEIGLREGWEIPVVARAEAG
jgi:SPP1 family predicted phage head-tail adaptor